MGRTVVVTGIAEHDGALKVYVGPRYHGQYVLIDDADAAQRVRDAWADVRQHVLIPSPPPGAIFTDPLGDAA